MRKTAWMTFENVISGTLKKAAIFQMNREEAEKDIQDSLLKIYDMAIAREKEGDKISFEEILRVFIWNLHHILDGQEIIPNFLEPTVRENTLEGIFLDYYSGFLSSTLFEDTVRIKDKERLVFEKRLEKRLKAVKILARFKNQLILDCDYPKYLSIIKNELHLVLDIQYWFMAGIRKILDGKVEWSDLDLEQERVFDYTKNFIRVFECCLLKANTDKSIKISEIFSVLKEVSINPII